MDLSLFGIQGCGKGTHAKLLAAEFDYDIFGAGAVLRRIATQDTEEGRLVKGLVDQGKLVPVEVTMKAVGSWLAAHEGRRVIFDGIPRSMEQLVEFNKIVKDAGRTLVGVHIALDEETAFKRIMARSSGRIDDATEEAIRRRLHICKETTMPVIEWYREHHEMIDVDGNASIEDVYANIKKALAL
jgi:adenylate kinase